MDEPTPQEQDAPQSEEELRARLEEEMKKVRVEDLLLQSVAGIINLTARRIAKPDEQDLEQGRIGIEATRALVGLLPEEAAAQVRQALSELQMLYAREIDDDAAGGTGEESGAADPADPADAAGAGAPAAGAGQAPTQVPPPGGEPPPRLWTPGR